VDWRSPNFVFPSCESLSLQTLPFEQMSSIGQLHSGAEHRIVSLLPSATELACSLGLQDQLVAITHCCDYPPEILDRPRVVRSALQVETLTVGELDAAVSSRLRAGESLYTVDENLLARLEPTLLLTQDLCKVCAPASNEVSRALQALARKPEVLWMSPHSIADIHKDLYALARATHRTAQAEARIARDAERLSDVASRVSRATQRSRVFCCEWIDPLFCSGHWVPEMVEIAGGTDVLGRKWSDSVRVSWDELANAALEILIVMPCGFALKESAAQTRQLLAHPQAKELACVRNGNVFAVDAGYYSRPSLRVVDGTELLAHVMHPKICAWRGAPDAFLKIDPQ
jgi:iron complex transport system substrate-binding protein